MANLLARVRVGLSGWEGGPGVNTLYFSPGTGLSWSLTNINGMMDEVHTAYSAMSSYYNSHTEITVNPDVDIIDTATGQLQDVYTATTELAPIGAPAQTQAAPLATAIVLRLSTDRFINGRRLQGRLFISPVSMVNFESDGSIKPGYAENYVNAFVAMTSGVGPRLAVFHRPTIKGQATGDWGDVIRTSVSSTPGVLRSRRD